MSEKEIKFYCPKCGQKNLISHHIPLHVKTKGLEACFVIDCPCGEFIHVGFVMEAWINSNANMEVGCDD
jgi:uncharacterized Zn finger protein